MNVNFNCPNAKLKVVVIGLLSICSISFESLLFGEVPLYNVSKRASDILKNVSTITKFLSINVEVDLLKHHNHNSELAHTIFTQSPYLKNCFLSAVQTDKRVGGFITYNFLVSEDSGTIKIIRRSGGTIIDLKLQDCVTKELLQIAIPIRKTMVGQLKLSFDYR